MKMNPYKFMNCLITFICMTFFAFILWKIDLAVLLFGKINAVQENTIQENTVKADEITYKIKDLSVDPEKQTVEKKQIYSFEENSIYRYTDNNQILVMVDSLEKVPLQFRDKMKIESYKSEQSKTEIQISNNRVLIPVKFNHKDKSITIWLTLDTGANITSISPAVANRLGIQNYETTNNSATLADGRSVLTAHTFINQVSAGPKTKNDLEVQILPRRGNEETGLLGMNFLKEFPHTIDTKSKVIKWQ